MSDVSKPPRAERHEALLAHLRARGSASMTELAVELEVSVRTLRRDVATLRLRGLDIEGERGRGGGIRFARFAPLPPLRLDEAEAVGLWLSVQLSRRVAGLPFSRTGRGGMSKVLAALPEARRQQLRRLCDRIIVGPGASDSVRESAGRVASTLLDAFERCFREQVCLGFQYTDRVGATTQRRIEPHGLYVELPVWYILAVDLDKQAQRMFRMDRIANPRALSQRFDPSGAVIEQMLERGETGPWSRQEWPASAERSS
jgi:predicted DNA-binding transcriptional regulator YafY